MGAFFVSLGFFAPALFYEPFRFRFERFIAWVVEPRAFWFGAQSAAVLIVLFRYGKADHERAFQYAGLALQLLGIGSVARGISQKLSAFGKTGLCTWILGWGRQFLAIFRRPTTDAKVLLTGVGAATGLGVAVARAQQTFTSWQQWVAFLQLEITRLEGEIKASNAKIETERGERIAAVDSVRKTLEDRISQTQSIAEKALVGSFRDEIVGVIWLATGTVFATIPKDIAGWW